MDVQAPWVCLNGFAGMAVGVADDHADAEGRDFADANRRFLESYIDHA